MWRDDGGRGGDILVGRGDWYGEVMVGGCRGVTGVEG